MVKFCVCPSFPFGTEGGMWDVIILIPDHCLSIYFTHYCIKAERILKEGLANSGGSDRTPQIRVYTV